jgi:hypothetical protein
VVDKFEKEFRLARCESFVEDSDKIAIGKDEGFESSRVATGDRSAWRRAVSAEFQIIIGGRGKAEEERQETHHITGIESDGWLSATPHAIQWLSEQEPDTCTVEEAIN